MRVLVCGWRDWLWASSGSIRSRLMKLDKGTTIINGDCEGVDRIADEMAKQIGLDREKYPANWVKYKKAAGPIRNIKMLKTSIDLVIAFHPNIANSTGTAHTVREAKKLGIPVEVHSG